MPIEQSLTGSNRSVWLEGGILLCISPFLLFPTLMIEVTLFSLVLLAFVWLLPVVSQRWSWPTASPFDLLMVCWGCVLILSIIVTADPDLTLPKAAGVILGIAVWRFMCRAVQSSRLLMGAIIVYGLLGMGFVLLGSVSVNWEAKVPLLSVLIEQFPQAQLFLPESSDLGIHANQLAGTLLFYVPFLVSVLFGFLLIRPSKKIFFGCLFLFVAALALLLVTQSRTGWIAFGGCVFIMTIMWWVAAAGQPKLRRILAAASLAMLLLGVLTILFIGPSRLEAIWQNPEQDSAIGQLGSIGFRQEVWTWAVTAIGDFPFTGIGLGSFQEVIRRFYPVNIAPNYVIAHAHNAYLQIALDVGLPGFVLYLALVGLMFFVGLRVARQSVNLRPYALGLLGSLAAFHLFGLFDTLALGSKSHLIFWVIFGLLTAMHRVQQPCLQENEPVLSLPNS